MASGTVPVGIPWPCAARPAGAPVHTPLGGGPACSATRTAKPPQNATSAANFRGDVGDDVALTGPAPPAAIRLARLPSRTHRRRTPRRTTACAAHSRWSVVSADDGYKLARSVAACTARMRRGEGKSRHDTKRDAGRALLPLHAPHAVSLQGQTRRALGRIQHFAPAPSAPGYRLYGLLGPAIGAATPRGQRNSSPAAFRVGPYGQAARWQVRGRQQHLRDMARK